LSSASLSKSDAQVRDAIHLPKKGKKDKKKEDKKREDGKKKAEKAAEPSVAMTEEQVAAARDEALSKLEKPLEKMKIKELMALLEERGLECKDCQGAEKSVIVGQVVSNNWPEADCGGAPLLGPCCSGHVHFTWHHYI
jgi:hypothetical protein